MKKFRIFVLIIFVGLFCFMVEPHAEDSADYLTYQEIIMSTGKLIRNMTLEDRQKVYGGCSNLFFGFSSTTHCESVKATYIATVKECMENSGKTDIKLTVDYSVETNTKVSFSSSGSISSSGAIAIGKFKSEAAAKANVEYSESTSKSIKEKRSIDLVIEPNSQYMVVVKGTLTVSNGAIKFFMFGVPIICGLYEFVTLESQYAVLEKRVINE